MSGCRRHLLSLAVRYLRYASVMMLAFSLYHSQSAWAELYRWTDANGKVHYSDRKPDEQVQSEQIDSSLKPLNIDDSRQEWKKLETVFPDHEDTSFSREKKRNQQAQDEYYTKHCKEAREYLSKLKGPVYFVDEEGNEYDISEKERKEREKEMEALIAEHCENY